MTGAVPRRLVTKRKYLTVMGLKLTLNTLATAAVAAGVLSVINFVCWIVIAYVSQKDTLRMWLGCNLLSVGISLLFLLGALMFKTSNLIEPVEVITSQNAHRLPLQETLVRVSDIPVADSGADLPRVPHFSHEPLQDEMLRTLGASTPSQ